MDSLFELVKSEDISGVSAFLANNTTFDVNMTNEKGQTPLYWACEFEDPQLASILIQNGANTDCSEQNGFTPLHLATRLANDKVMKLLLEHKADPNAKSNTGITPLHIATKNGSAQLIQILLDAGGDLTLTDRHGMSPVDYMKGAVTAKVQLDPNLAEASRAIKENVFLRKAISLLLDKLKTANDKPIDMQQSNDQVAELERQLQLEKRKALCAVCHLHEKDTVVLPCMHLYGCFRCVTSLQLCRNCNKPVEGMFKCLTT